MELPYKEMYWARMLSVILHPVLTTVYILVGCSVNLVALCRLFVVCCLFFVVEN